MTKTQARAEREANTMAREANEAAALIKATAESTATALNIQYIQKDILEIKESVKGLVASQDSKVDELQNKFDNLSKIVYVGAGTLAGLELLLKFIVK